MSCSIVIFGASGDLTRRKLIPALYWLHRKNRLPEETQILARWLFTPGVRLVELDADGPALVLPLRAAGSLRAAHDVDLRDPVPVGMA